MPLFRLSFECACLLRDFKVPRSSVEQCLLIKRKFSTKFPHLDYFCNRVTKTKTFQMKEPQLHHLH